MTFWGNFQSLFDTYWGMLVTKWCSRVEDFIKTVFRVAPQKRSNDVKWHDFAGHLISQRRAIRRPGSLSCNKAIFAPIVWHVAPSCWNHIFPKSHSSIAGKKKVSYHMTIILQIDGYSRSIIIFKEVRSNHTFGSKSAPNSDFFWM